MSIWFGSNIISNSLLLKTIRLSVSHKWTNRWQQSLCWDSQFFLCMCCVHEDIDQLLIDWQLNVMYCFLRRGLMDFPHLNGGDKLCLLNLQHNFISHLQYLTLLPRLVFLDLYDNRLIDVSGISSLTSLRVLLLGKNRCVCAGVSHTNTIAHGGQAGACNLTGMLLKPTSLPLKCQHLISKCNRVCFYWINHTFMLGMQWHGL